VVNLKNILAGWVGGVSFNIVPGTIGDIADGKFPKLNAEWKIYDVT